MTDYYEILGVSHDDSSETIKQAYRRLAKKYHPDLNQGDAKSEARFKAIGEAWATLGDAQKRQKYNAARSAAVGGDSGVEQTQRPRAPKGTADYFDVMQKFGTFFGDDEISRMAKKNGGSEEKNPIDTSGIFERFMGFKK